jgi:DNA-binding CsgD family transcriptional regulator
MLGPHQLCAPGAGLNRGGPRLSGGGGSVYADREATVKVSPVDDNVVRSDDDGAAVAIASRVLELVSSRSAAGDSTGETVLLDVTVGTVRCLVLRVEPGDIPGGVGLSPREQEIARMVALGYTNKAIAQVLEISLWTVSTHLRRIFAKLRVNSRAAMVARLARTRVGGGATARIGRDIEEASSGEAIPNGMPTGPGPSALELPPVFVGK